MPGKLQGKKALMEMTKIALNEHFKGINYTNNN